MTDQEKIDEIMDNFDFAKVEKAMHALEWQWGHRDSMHYPDVPELRKFAHDLLKSVLAKGLCGSTTGGFRVTNEGGELMLSFNVAEWYVCDGDEQEATS